MFTPYIFDLAWQSIAIAFCVASIALLCRLCVMQPVAQVRHVCGACRRIARGSDDHRGVTEEIVAMRGRRRDQ